MSLDLSNRSGLSFNGTAVTNTIITTATFDGGAGENGSCFALYVDTSGGAVSLNTLPTNLTQAGGAPLFEDGMTITVIKNTADANAITFTDPISTRTMSFVNRQDERICLKYDGAGSRWVFV